MLLGKLLICLFIGLCRPEPGLLAQGCRTADVAPAVESGLNWSLASAEGQSRPTGSWPPRLSVGRDVSVLNRWLEEAGLSVGPIFRQTGDEVALDQTIKPSTVSEILKRRAAEAGLDAAIARRPSGHSMRVGAVQDMAAAGIKPVAIMHAGSGRSPEMVMRYIEHMDVRKSGMARFV